MNSHALFFNVSLVLTGFYLLTAKSSDLLRPSGRQWVSVLAWGHGGATVHVAAGERGKDGWHSGGQRPQSGAARRGQSMSIYM